MSHMHSRLPQSRRAPPLLPLIVAKYIQSAYPAALDPFLAQSSIDRTTLDDPALKDNVPDLQTVIEAYEAWQLEEQVRGVSLKDGTARSSNADSSDSKLMPLAELVKKPVTPGAITTVLQSVRETYDQIGTGGFLSVKWERVAKREFDTATASYRASYPHRIIVTSTDKTLKTLDPETGEVDQLLQPHKAAILSFAIHPTQPRYIITSSMDSTAILTDLITLAPLQTFRHAKFVVRCAFSPNGRWLATASYDRTIILYEDSQWDYRSGGAGAVAAEDEQDALDEGDDVALARDPMLRYEERHKIVLDQNPESIIFDAASRYLLYTTRSSHLLRYVLLPQAGEDSTTPTPTKPFETRTKSFNPHPDDSHISFAVLNLVLDPSGRMIACQTGDHAGGTGERVLIYDVNLPPASATTNISQPNSRTSWLNSRAEPSAIPPQNQRLSVIWTGQEGDDYVLPRLAWLPDSSGVITTTTTGWLAMHSLGGETVARLKVHGGATAQGNASEVIRDVCVMGDKDDVKGWRAISVGYDATVRIT